ncbi:GNAT family N-acetyltransferase [Actinoplanes sp. N902-109]|uniref:GNAT family N-acetyltransferase n=1 Tax=Actinoplanes sp. (strain N902-109) TaxID=649831 RepID=UPI0003294233|nr:GNAT family protein [Actinoplanes sp. N902-109]AGL18493.1 GCN5-like N-acetyltransferase [Actinoplanes sp. N902-109]
MTGDFSIKPTISGDLVVLRPFQAGDYPAIVTALQDPEVLRLTGSSPFTWDETGHARLREWYATRNDQTDRLDLAITDRATGQWVGEVVLHKVDKPNANCTFRMLIGPSGRDRGLGTESVRLLVRYAFEQLDLHRIALQVYPFNPRARHVYEKAGFVAEGIEREVLRTGDGWSDAVTMAILNPAH